MKKPKNIMVQGTTSDAGKSFLAAALCRIFLEDGLEVFPFKSQNMSSTFVTTKEGLKLSTSQALQAMAAGKEPRKEMNPILLIPTSDSGSGVNILGKPLSHMEAVDYFEYKKKLLPFIKEVYESIPETDIIVIEGAGSPAEINLRENDFVNMGLADMVDAPVILVADIDRGGVFASLYGTVMLLSESERQRIKGLVINKFRGDIELLKPGIDMFRDFLDIPILGVIPYIKTNFVDENTFAQELYVNEMVYATMDAAISHMALTVRKSLQMDLIYQMIDE